MLRQYAFSQLVKDIDETDLDYLLTALLTKKYPNIEKGDQLVFDGDNFMSLKAETGLSFTMPSSEESIRSLMQEDGWIFEPMGGHNCKHPKHGWQNFMDAVCIYFQSKNQE